MADCLDVVALEACVVEDALSRIGKCLGFNVVHYNYDGGCSWYYTTNKKNLDEPITVFLSSPYCKCHYKTAVDLLESALASDRFIFYYTSDDRRLMEKDIVNPFAKTRSLEELWLKLDLLDS